jgi:hypothetical protein
MLVAAIALGAPAAAAARPKAVKLKPGRASGGPVFIRDVIVRDRRPGAHAASYGGVYTTSGGDQVRVLSSDAYAPSDAVNQSWADFLAQLPHGSELSRLTIYIAPYAEMVEQCSAEANSCYIPEEQTIVAAGDVPPDGTPVEDLVRHEYGHHLAANRSNAPWAAIDWGTKNWASYEGVCPGVREGFLYPGDEGDGYSLNPGEAFAESYRVFAGGDAASWGIVDDAFYPNDTDMRYIQQDVSEPWTKPSKSVYTGRFSRRGRRVHKIRVDTFRDGRAQIDLKGKSGLDDDLYVYGDDGALLKKSATRSRKERVRFTVCGQSTVLIRVVRDAGKGSYRLTVLKP